MRASACALSQVGRRLLKLPAATTLTCGPVPVEAGVPIPAALGGGRVPRQRVTVTGPLGVLTKDLESFITLTPVPGVVGGGAEGGRAMTVAVLNPAIKQQRVKRGRGFLFPSAGRGRVAHIHHETHIHTHAQAMWGTARALLGNMVEGVTDGCNLSLRLVGVGYRGMAYLRACVCRCVSAMCSLPPTPATPRYTHAAALDKDPGTGAERLTLRLGYAHPIHLAIPAGIQVTVPVPQRILLSGCDWEAMTGFAANIRKWRKPEPYNQKGIFVGEETIKKKEGKKR
jgi:ribosomal protein L6P/L9E